jgi:hypothetical protein
VWVWYGQKRVGSGRLITKGVFVWDYNPPGLYNLTYFELSASSK